MKTFTNDVNKKTLEFPDLRQAQTRITATLSVFKKLWRFFLIDAKKNELQVRWEERSGYTSWKVYDPMTGKVARFSSEAEMLQWIEDYYS